MRYLFSVFLGLCLSVVAGASPASPTKADADSAYQNKDYAKAIALYEELVRQTPSSDLYYNMGNAYFRQDQIGQAVLAYERALHFNPEHKDARHNIELVRSRLTDRFPSSSSFFAVGWTSWITSKNVTTWVAWSLLWAVLTIVLSLLYRLSYHLWLRKIGFFGAILTLVCFLLATTFAFLQRQAFYNNSRAVVMVESATTYNSPTENSTPSRTLHTGTTVNVLEHFGKTWVQIELPDGKIVWIKSDVIEDVLTEL